MSITISVSDSLFRTGSFINNIANSIMSYKHTLSVWKGYDNASISFAAKPSILEDWLLNGLGRHIEVYDYTQTKIFEGFVDDVALSQGILSVDRGPVLDVLNQLKLTYSLVIENPTGDNIIGGTEETTFANDTTSQGQYGIRSNTMSSGNITLAAANQLRDNQLENLQDPETTQTLSFGSSSASSISLSVRGYSDFLNYPYNNATLGTQDISTKIQNIISQELNGIISTDFSQITPNTFQVETTENENNLGLSLIKGLVSLGDNTNARYSFGVYNDRIATYAPVPTSILYEQKLTDPFQRITTITGKQVDPQNVLPGNWLLLADFLIGQDTPTSLRLDPRAVFLERVEFSTPYNLQISGGKVSTLPQKLAKLGIGGINF